MSFTLSAPASSANLGAGFDAVAIALDLRMRATVEVLPPGATSEWTYGGPEAPTHDGLRGCIERALVRVDAAAPALRVRLDNAIPLGAGLGSSAAASALGAAIAARAGAQAPDGDVLATIVAELEGHPDNALAAWYGGAVVAAHGDDGLHAARFAPPPLHAAVAIPALALATADARALMPDAYTRADAVHSVQRAALLGAALAGGRVDLLRAAMRDRLHQPYRAAAVPGLREMLALEEPGLVAVALSGAGPSVLALAVDDAAARRAGERLVAIFARHGVAARARTPAFATHGLVEEQRADRAGERDAHGAGEASRR